MCLERTCSNIFFICRTVEDPSRLDLKENVMTYNIKENGLSLVIDDGEVYLVYRIVLNKMPT